MKTTELQDLIFNLLAQGPTSFENIFANIEQKYREKWQEQAKNSGEEYEKVLVKKQGEIYTHLISDGYVTVTNDGKNFNWMIKDKLKE